MLSFAILTAALALPMLFAVASSIECTTQAQGYFYVDETVYADPFSLMSNGTLYFDTLTGTAFQAEFQACTPNYLGYTNDVTNGTYAGHVYIPSLGLCLSVQDPWSSPPYEVTTAACGMNDDKQQFLLNWVMIGSKIFYGGRTTADGSSIQGGANECTTGLYGYQGDEEAIPTAFGYPTPLVCSTGEDVHGFTLLE